MKSKAAISAWLVDYLARALELEPTMIDPSVHLGDYGIDSAAAAGLSADLSEWLGVALKESIAFEYPTVLALSEHVVGLQGGGEASHV